MPISTKLIFVVALDQKKSKKPTVYYVQCPSMMEAAMTVSKMLKVKLRPCRRHVDSFDELKKSCAELYGNDNLEFHEFEMQQAEATKESSN